MSRRNGRLVVLRACPAPLAQMLGEGGSVLLDARFSTASGQAAFEKAANNFASLVRKLLTAEIIDVSESVPSTQEIIRGLENSDDIQKSTDDDSPDRTFLNTFYVSTCGQVVVHVSVGSGAKISRESQHQPAMLHLARQANSTRPVLVALPETSRWGRAETDMGVLFRAFERLHKHHRQPAYLARTAKHGFGVEPFTDVTKLAMLMETVTAGSEPRS